VKYTVVFLYSNARAVFTPIIELANKAEETEKLKPSTIKALPQK